MKMKHSLFIKALFVAFLLIAISGYSQDRSLNLMPYPAHVESGAGEFVIKKNFKVSLLGEYDHRLKKEAARFLRRLDNETGLFFPQHSVNGYATGAALTVEVSKPGKVQLHEDESYQLEVTPAGISLKAATDIGAIRGLETLLQLREVHNGRYIFPAVQIKDSPRFVWRGLMLDVARHYMPLHVIYRNLDAMAAVKLNVLHLHLSDDQGFRFKSDAYPELTDLASDGLFYTKRDLKNIISYADQRGIRVMPEIDVPGHATSILVAFPELGSKDTSYVLERYAGIFDPTLDPTNDDVYVFLQTLFSEIAEVFSDPFFHIGGDENMGKHWNENEQIRAFMREQGLKTNHDLQTYFNIRLQKILTALNKRVMGWEEIMTPKMPKSAVIHSWRGEWEGVPAKESLYAAARNGYETVLSNGYYLDLMQPTSYHYLVDPAPASEDLSEIERKRILGGEMCMWSELVIPETVDSRLWPRGAAIAERFWSPESVNNVEDMYRRLEMVSLQLEQLGLQHVTARNMILRNLTDGKDIGPLKTLVEVVEPMKGYTRNPGGTMYASYSPFKLWADAATADARVAREFNISISNYVEGHKESDQILATLRKWEKNHKKVEALISESPVLLEISDLSFNFSRLAVIGREAISYLESNEVPQSGWVLSSRKALQSASKSGGRTELQIIPGIELLIDQVEALAK